MKRTPLRRKTPLRFRSKKTAKLYEERRELVSRVLTERPVCEWPEGCGRRSEQVHEPLTRARGGSILDEANTVSLCAPHHRHLHDHPKEATALGMLRHSWDA